MGGNGTVVAGFVLNASVLDDWETITSVTIDTSGLAPIAPESLSVDTFSVHAVGTSPLPVAADDVFYREYDLDREITAARLDADGNIVLELKYGVDELGCASLGFIGSKGMVRLNLTYTVTQNSPLAGPDGAPVTIAAFEQGPIVNAEVDAFNHHVSDAGVKYRLFTPTAGTGPRPLIVWLHGGGEGGYPSDGYYDNETQLRGTRGALGFATPEGQRIFDGAYVLAPQCDSNWLDDGAVYATQVYDIIRDLVDSLPIDGRRIYVAGGSSGAYLTLELVTRYPDLFAAAVPASCIIQDNPRHRGPDPSPRLVPDDALAKISTPTWLIVSSDDTIVDPLANSVHAHKLIPGSRISAYEHVVWNDFTLPGHWSWIYLSYNDPAVDGTHVWQWMAEQHR